MINDDTKVCPFCGEEIQSVVVKCSYCGEFLEHNADKFANIDVNEKWKQRFNAVDFFVEDGKWWKYKPDFWKIPFGKRLKTTCKIYGDLGSFLATIFFGGFYYLFKGMWLKFIIYGTLSVITGGLLWVWFPCFSPYDYFRYNVLGKQW